jgi:predicted RNase H-like HicB family nuclease
VKTFQYVIERDLKTKVLVGSVVGWLGAHSQGADIAELEENLREVIEMLLEDGEPALESEYVEMVTIRIT